MLEKESFDGVLMDCQMPIMDGYTATREIRKQDKYKELPIIAMTANVMSGDKEKVMNAGMNDHFGKPINVREMFNTMAKWITPSEPHGELPVREIDQDDSNLLIPDLPGIDTTAGLQVSQGNKKLYIKLLIKFLNGQRDFENKFHEALNSDDRSEPERMAHTLKGLAGNIGAIDIRNSVIALEKACQNKDNSIEKLLEKLLVQLKPVIAGLDEFASSITEVQSSVDIDIVRMKNLLSQLKELLEEDDTEATDVLDELLPMLKEQPEAETIKAMAQAIEAYDFSEALELFNQIEVK